MIANKAPRIVAVVSHKGGTGKTSLVQNLAYEYGRSDPSSVLVVDFDPQSNLTAGSGLMPQDLSHTVYHAINQPDDCEKAIVHGPYYDILPANLDLAISEQQFAGEKNRNDKLKRALATVSSRYKFIFIDSPPNLSFFAFNTLTAATQAIIPLQCQPYAYQAIDSTTKLIELVQNTNTSLSLKAIILTMYDKRLSLSKSLEEITRRRFEDIVSRTVIPVNVSIPEAILDHSPVGAYAPQSSGAIAYQLLAKELQL